MVSMNKENYMNSAQPYPCACSIKATISVIGGKWKAVILYYLLNEGVHRFTELRRKVPGISEKILTQQLRDLERDGVIQRKVYPEVPPKVEYSITEYGETLRPLSIAMREWGNTHIERS